MKKTILLFLYSVLFFNPWLFAGNKINAPTPLASTEQSLKTQAEDFIKNQPVQFLENNGQMTDMAGNPVPFVLFKIDAPGLDLFITEKGLTYVFKTSIEDDSASLTTGSVVGKKERRMEE